MRTVRILEEASQEAIEAAAWYEFKQPGLGSEFFAAVEAAIDVIEENLIPLSPRPEDAINPSVKRLMLNRFPYDMIAIESPAETIVIAVAHHSRKPGYWLERAKA